MSSIESAVKIAATIDNKLLIAGAVNKDEHSMSGIVDKSEHSGIMSSIDSADTITAEISNAKSIAGQIQEEGAISSSISIPIRLPGEQVYDGETHVTPSTETQILKTKDKYVTKDITIDPIPQNYGLITWDGVKLTVS